MTKTKKRENLGQNLLIFLMIAIIVGIIAIAIFIGANIAIMAKNPLTLEDVTTSNFTIIYDKNGDEFERLGVEKGTAASEYPELLKKAVISVEDKRFYTHEGFDIIRIGKAVLDTLKNHKFGAGGSTITQQLVKNVTGDTKVSISRKVREVLYSVAIEQECSKDQILTRYLNIIYLGKGNYGMTDAIRMYFGKSPENLSIAEAAFMAAIIKSPETYIKDLDRANDRKNLVLGYMLDQEMISQEECDEAKDKYVEIKTSAKASNVNSWFTDSLIVEFANQMSAAYNIEYGEAISKIYSGGYKIYSTVDPELQDSVYEKYRNMPDSIGSVQSGCIVLSKTGEVTAICGSTGRKTGNMLFNRATSARRQPGSSIKPLAVYGPAFNEGVINTLSSYEDKAVDYKGWIPKNYYEGYSGYMSIRNAIAISNNSIAVQVLNDIGSDTGISYLRKLGFKTQDADNALTLALGAVDEGYTPMEMASGYQCLCNGGVWCEPIFYTKIEKNNGSLIYDSKTMQESRQVFSQETAFIITDLLKSVVEWENGTGRYMAMSSIEIAAKTGTTTQNKDKWLCAYTPDYVLASWYGYDTPAEINVSSKLIQNIAKSILQVTDTKNKAFARPETACYYEVCKNANCLATENCAETYAEIFDTTKTLPEVCSVCQGSIISDVQEEIQNGAESLIDFFGNLIGGNKQEQEPPTEEYIEPEVTETEEQTEDISVDENYEEYYQYEYDQVA